MYPPILEPLINSPQLPQLLARLNAYWQDEQARRQAFYDWVGPDIKAEFIDGEIIVHSPVRSRHSTVLKYLVKLIDTYVEVHGLGYVGYESNMCRFPRNDYEPDLCFFDTATATAINDTTTIFPVPQLIVEVLSASTKDRDRGVKFRDYQVNGVGEYWIVNADTDVIEQYLLQNGVYRLATKARPGDALRIPTLADWTVDAAVFFDAAANLRAVRAV